MRARKPKSPLAPYCTCRSHAAAGGAVVVFMPGCELHSQFLTPRQRDLCAVLRSHKCARLVTPSQRELGRRLGGISSNAVRCLLDAVKRKGLVTWSPRQSRTVQLLPIAARGEA